MVEKYLKICLTTKNIPFDETENGIEIDCSGNPFDFDRTVSLIYKNLEKWTYDLQLPLKIQIDLESEKVVISL